MARFFVVVVGVLVAAPLAGCFGPRGDVTIIVAARVDEPVAVAVQIKDEAGKEWFNDTGEPVKGQVTYLTRDLRLPPGPYYIAGQSDQLTASAQKNIDSAFWTIHATRFPAELRITFSVS